MVNRISDAGEQKESFMEDTNAIAFVNKEARPRSQARSISWLPLTD